MVVLWFDSTVLVYNCNLKFHLIHLELSRSYSADEVQCMGWSDGFQVRTGPGLTLQITASQFQVVHKYLDNSKWYDLLFDLPSVRLLLLLLIFCSLFYFLKKTHPAGLASNLTSSRFHGSLLVWRNQRSSLTRVLLCHVGMKDLWWGYNETGRRASTLRFFW